MKRVVILAAMSALASLSFGASILGTTTVLSNSGGEYGAGAELIHALNQDGLQTGYTNGVTDYDAYLAGNPMHTLAYFNAEWFTPIGVHGSTLVLDLGANYNVSGMAYWNEDAAGVARVTVTTSLLSDFSVSAGAGTLSPTDNANGSDYGADNYLFSTRAARYVMLDLVGPQDSAYDYIGVGEIAFRVEAVPEPVSMIALGAGALALIRRRRK